MKNIKYLLLSISLAVISVPSFSQLNIEAESESGVFPELLIGKRTTWHMEEIRQANQAAMFKEAIEAQSLSQSSMGVGLEPERIIDPSIPFDPSIPLEPIDPFEPIDPIISVVYDPGDIPMTTDVSPTGAFTVQVPIECYPGIKGVQPNISIAYNSQQGYGILGQGWGISGISKIRAIPKSIHFDGKTEGVNPTYSALTDNDALALDGVRLIRLSQGNYVSVTGNIKVSATVSSATGNPLIGEIKVHYPNGSVAAFSTTAFASFKEYPITRFTDRNGNQMNFTYAFHDTGSSNYSVSKITYGAENMLRCRRKRGAFITMPF